MRKLALLSVLAFTLVAATGCPSGDEPEEDIAEFVDVDEDDVVSLDEGDCAPGQPCICDGDDCVVRCEGVGCDFVCTGTATCSFTCPDGGCSVRCRDAASCALDCPGGGCNVMCEGASTCDTRTCDELPCDLDCRDSATCEMSCAAGSCLGACQETSTCIMDSCPSGCALTCNDEAACAMECAQEDSCFVSGNNQDP